VGGNESRSPVFVLTLHRGGGTVLVRVLNCHPELVIWGEHVGLINRLAEIDDMVTRVGRLMAPKTDEAIAEYVTFPEHRLTEFDPWANPFDYDSFTRSCRELPFQRPSKESGLREFQRRGWVLVDATYESVNVHSKDRDQVIIRDYDLLRKDLARMLPDRSVPIILMKANICRLLDRRLRNDEFNVLNRGLVVYFPSTGRQKDFERQFGEILKTAADA